MGPDDVITSSPARSQNLLQDEEYLVVNDADVVSNDDGGNEAPAKRRRESAANQGSVFKFQEVVRKKADREKLAAFTCTECEKVSWIAHY